MQKEKQDFIIAILIGTLFVLLFGLISFLVIANYIKRKRKLVLEKEIYEANFQQAVMRAQLEMQEHTFRVISQDIHDNVGQILSLVKLNLNIISAEQKENETFNNLKELVMNAMSELRDLGTGYHTDRLIDKGLLLAIQHQLHLLEKTGMFTISFKSELTTMNLDRNKTIFLYRMIQESLNNIVKHACASHIRVSIFKNDNETHIVLEDDGHGFSRDTSEFKAGIGLSSIQQRASMIDARVYINSAPGYGTVVNFVFK
jgi:signal transduction histidine kinase